MLVHAQPTHLSPSHNQPSRYNKGLAFSDEERDRLHLRGLLPPAVLPQATQAARAMVNVRSKAADLDRLTYLTSLQVCGGEREREREG